MQRDSYTDENGEYFIRSIYFDTRDYGALHEKLGGVDNRKKYRIRFYNSNSEECKLECKEKKGTRVTKTSENIDNEMAKFLLSDDRMQLNDRIVTGSMAQKICRLGLVPVVTVDYVREAFVLPVSNLRVTFDKDIAAGGIRNCLGKDRLMSDIMGNNMVLEVKYDDFIPEHISRLISSINPVQTAASKYVMCLEYRFNTFL
jgi:SPX domain protein involved in polyphosphate accumulation